MLDLRTHFRVIAQILLRILSALPDLIAVISIPGTALIDDIILRRQIQDISHHGNTLAEHDIKFRLLKRRRDLILNHLHPRSVTDHFSALLQGLDPSDIQTNGRIELQSASAGGRLRVAEHHPHLLTQLVDKDHRTVGFADDRRQLPQRLRHQTRLQAHMAVSHVTVNLRLRHKRCHRVHYDDIHRAGTHHGLRDLQRLLTAIRLGYVKVVDIHPDILRIDRIQGMFRINKSRDAAPLLYFRDHM